MEDKNIQENVSVASEIKEWIKSALIAIAIFFIINVFFFAAKVDGASMEPNFHDGDRLIIQRQHYTTDKLPQYGDVVIVYCETKGYTIIKRVIGLPGDKIEIKDGEVYRNGTKLDESAYLDVETCGEINTTVEDGHIFVLGDNRPDSADSRYAQIGQISLDNIKGKALCRVFPNPTIIK